MPLNDTYTLAGTGADSFDFSSVGAPSGDQHNYTADSPTGDLDGRLTLAVKHTTDSKGLRRSLVSLREPVAGADGVYDEFIQVNLTVTRPGTLPTADVTSVIVALRNFFSESGVSAAIAEYEV